MLKWMATGKEGEGEEIKITSDPLATINFKKKKKNEIYSVNRLDILLLFVTSNSFIFFI